MASSLPTVNHHEIQHWAASRQLVPAEIIRHSIDHNPAILKLVPELNIADHIELRELSWEEFFLRFDCLGLAFAYDNDSFNSHELLQSEERSPYRNPEYRPVSTSN